ncbi:hypothetical protein EDB86DRAFT_1976459 [Lactarius hatsudake]|nr:hypothetical protein EDB86DRAFT_1976459 [Lactarius hatsudake]
MRYHTRVTGLVGFSGANDQDYIMGYQKQSTVTAIMHSPSTLIIAASPPFSLSPHQGPSSESLSPLSHRRGVMQASAERELSYIGLRRSRTRGAQRARAARECSEVGNGNGVGLLQVVRNSHACFGATQRVLGFPNTSPNFCGEQPARQTDGNESNMVLKCFR